MGDAREMSRLGTRSGWPDRLRRRGVVRLPRGVVAKPADAHQRYHERHAAGISAARA